VEGEKVCERIAEEKREEGNGSGDARGAQKNLEVERIGEEYTIILQIPVVNERAVANQPEAVRKHERVRQQKKKTDPEQWRG
jgi:hypothetical protein